MAAIDKIYVDSWDKYFQFSSWCKNQPKLIDKYGKEESITEYLYSWKKESWTEHKCRPIFSAPYYVDAYVIRNCPFDFIQEELMVNYGYWSQKRIKSYYEDVINWKGEDDCPYWAKPEDFIILKDGRIKLKGLEKSSYELIRENKLYTSPSRSDYEYGKHFRCIKHPINFYNRPFNCGSWFVDVDIPNDYMWYHSNHNSWDFPDEFVISEWSSSSAHVKTIKALKRLMRKWKLPIGAKVKVTGRYMFDNYEFIITK